MNILKRVLRFFDTCCYNDGLGEGELNGGVVDELVGVEEKNDPTPEDDINTYLGSKEVNPDQRPLKNFDREGMTKDDIDVMVEAAGDEIMLSDEVIAKKAEEDKGKKKEGENQENNEDPEKKEDSKQEKDDEVSEFFEKAGITPEEFTSLPEKLQERVTELFEAPASDDKSTELIAATNKKYTEQKKIVETMLDDPVIAAAVEEMRTGKRFVARELPGVSRSELRVLMDASDNEEQFETAINELLATKGESVISAERSIGEQRFQVKELEKDAMKVVSKIMEMEDRLATKEKDLLKIDEDHPEYDTIHGENGIMGILKKSGYSLKKIIDWGPERALNDIQYAMGWHQDKFKKAEKNGQKKLIDKIKEAAKSAKGLDFSKKSTRTESSKEDGYDRSGLVDSIASGDTALWNKLYREAGERVNTERLQELDAIYAEGLNKRKSK